MSSAKLERHVVVEPLSPEEAAVFDLAKRRFYAANATAKTIIEGVGAGLSDEEIVARVCQEFEVDEATCRSDVASFLAHLRDEGLIARAT
ncbi:MAG: PqqD family protein [Polyangiales bacterium]